MGVCTQPEPHPDPTASLMESEEIHVPSVHFTWLTEVSNLLREELGTVCGMRTYELASHPQEEQRHRHLACGIPTPGGFKHSAGHAALTAVNLAWSSRSNAQGKFFSFYSII